MKWSQRWNNLEIWPRWDSKQLVVICSQTRCLYHTEWPQRQWSEFRDETPFRYAHTKIQTQVVVVICGPMRYQLDHGGVSLRVRQIKEFNWGEGEKPIHTQQFKVYWFHSSIFKTESEIHNRSKFNLGHCYKQKQIYHKHTNILSIRHWNMKLILQMGNK